MEPTRRLLWGCYYDDQEIIREAIKSGAKIDGEPDGAVTPLVNACKSARQETVRILLDAGADPGKAIEDGTTPLHIVARRNSGEIAEDLIRAGADPAVRNAYGRTAVDVALEDGHDEVAIAIRSMISLAHANKAKVLRFPAHRHEASGQKKPQKQPVRKLAKAGLKV